MVGGRETEPAVIDWLMTFYEAAGKQPIRINKEIFGHLINRLQMALWREVIYLVNEGRTAGVPTLQTMKHRWRRHQMRRNLRAVRDEEDRDRRRWNDNDQDDDRRYH